MDPVRSFSSAKEEKPQLGWFEWLKGWYHLVLETFFEKYWSRHLPNPLPLPPLDGITSIVTGSTSGIGLEIARQLAEAGAHVVMAMDPVRSFSSAKEEKPQLGWFGWLKGWYHLVLETFFEKYWSRHLPNPLPLPPLDGITSIVTGSTSGIGLEIAKQLAEAGAHVVMAVIDTNLAYKLVQKWQAKLRNTSSTKILNIDVMELNLSSLESIARFADTWNSKNKPLNILINNAGIFSMGKPQTFSTDGYEMHMHVNFLAPSLLSLLLLPSLKTGSPSRIVNVNSLMHAIGFVDTRDLNFDKVFVQMWQRDLPRIIQIAFQVAPFLYTAQEGSRSILYAAVYNEIWQYCDKLKAEEWPICPYVACNCKTMIRSKEAQNLEVSRFVWKTTLDTIGFPNDAVDLLLSGKKIQWQ
ncbi:hypothetical protein CTI12_AA443180 [Artemisia annua]|uniref:Glucose/ribitol dehydrogenase n=1 Tax=Artemisia annua TaxID=35608 RepID=A0A2U1LRC5_ARTAN|nr:hypothetical protein CTI12_AA443180 [Artemisia annua]